mmetsp:Transcript_22873/g.42769  ORF Transcript_22873/g.42769 Transcript_22873/m.42769 type:complete len:276 (-) Transcript_22873:688-1515(-)|eukprot:CAMPEP_0184519248 /NCGR_PEP_ID=MMETSP0198_2-20121128/6528_1 /TAXON_ID=1112570 /ORGANISM="Thraustochytrium sp., Strain LLF1b" /LENGTH=275 /DNA_ID=CAMNT_0026909757 /DNA_START=224 /DNA_END=1051 /DNA_ORIENTATION=+
MPEGDRQPRRSLRLQSQSSGLSQDQGSSKELETFQERKRARKAKSGGNKNGNGNENKTDPALQTATHRKLSLPRCYWATKNEVNQSYHDEHWGVPIRNKKTLFEVISLCSQQAGVSWSVVWKKRHAYQAAFFDWDLDKVAAMCDEDIDQLILSAEPGGIMRNRAKLSAIVHNAKLYQSLEREHPGGVVGFLWGFTQGRPVVNESAYREGEFRPNVSTVSDAMAVEFKKRGFKYLGSITLQAFAEQVGIINNHCATCFMNPRSQQAQARVQEQGHE